MSEKLSNFFVLAKKTLMNRRKRNRIEGREIDETKLLKFCKPMRKFLK